MKVSIKGTLIGGIVDVVSSTILGLPFAIYAMSKIDLAHTPRSQASAAVTDLIHRSPALHFGELLVGLACSVLGGYVAACVTKHDELLNGGLSSWLCTILGIYAIAAGKDSNPHWIQMLLLLASPLAALLGGDLRRRMRQNRPHDLQAV